MIEKLPFGRTGHISSRLLFGAAALGGVTQAEAEGTLSLVIDSGINHFDTAASYGKAEERMGPWLKGHRNEIFLATKTEKRTKKEALAELEKSLSLMRTDHIDLWQMHVLINEEEWETAMGEDGALAAFTEAKKRGLVRFLGVTGHGKSAPSMHIRSLDRFDFDSVLFPWNWQLSRDPAYVSSVHTLLYMCRKRNVAVQLIKAFLRRPWGDQTRTWATWYEPVEGPADIASVLGWALNVECSFVNSPGDINLLPAIIKEYSKTPLCPDDRFMEALASRLEMKDLFE